MLVGPCSDRGTWCSRHGDIMGVSWGCHGGRMQFCLGGDVGNCWDMKGYNYMILYDIMGYTTIWGPRTAPS